MQQGIKLKKKPLEADKVLVIGFAMVILIGALILTIPQCAITRKSIGFFDALFTATSAVCVTGLVVVDTATTFSVLGKVVIICLIQIGGLGFMIFGTLIMIALGKRISLKNRMLIRDSFNTSSLSGVVRLSIKVLIIALCVETFGAIVLSIRFIPMYGVSKGIAFGIFHAISAFCNAGFDLFGNFKSLEQFSLDPLVTITIAILIIIGGLGFIVINDLIEKRFKFSKLNLHSKIVVMSTAFLIISGTLLIFLTEYDNLSIWNNLTNNFFTKLLNSFFQSATVRTAGFSSVDQGKLSNAGKLVSVLYMFIGASPTSTGGGIKTTSMFIMILHTLHTIKGSEDISVFNKRISPLQIKRAFSISMISIAALITSTLLLCIFERHTNAKLIDLLFETVSAMATVGLSGVSTPSLSYASCATLIPIMFLGRVGPLTIAFALASKAGTANNKIQYPEERILIG